MCRQVACRTCGLTTWAGCGQHVDQVMRGVPKSQQCSCAVGASATSGQTATTGFLGRLLGR